MKNNKYFFAFAIFTLLLNIHQVKALDKTVDDYSSLKKAINDSETKKIILNDDIIVTDDPGLTISSEKDIVIDLNGKTISMESTKSTTSYLIYNKGNLTIKDATDINKNGEGKGRITYSSTNPDGNDIPTYASNTITNSGTLILESGLIENSTKKAPAAYVIDNNSSNGDAKVIINGGKINSVNNWGIRMFVNSNTKDNAVTLNKGYINGGLWMQTLTSKPKANFIVNGGTIKGNTYAFYVYDPSTNGSNVNIKINDGNFVANKENGNAIYIYDTNSNFQINNGLFEGEYALTYFTYNKSDDLTHVINNGVFNGYIELDQKFITEQNKYYTSNFQINDGKFSNDIYVWAHDGSDWYFSTNTKFINGGLFSDIMDGEYESAWPSLVAEPLTATSKMKSTPVKYPYTVGYKIILDANYKGGNNNTIYALKDGSMTELEAVTRNGYIFLGWNTKKDGTGSTVTKNSKINKDTILYAQWKIVPGNIETKVLSNDIVVAVNEETLNDAVLSNEEIQSIANGKNIKIDVLINDISTNILPEEKSKISEQIKDKKIGSYIDISIVKTIDGEEKTLITNTNNKLKFTIDIPKELIVNDNTERTYYIIRMHDGEVEILDTVYDDKNNTLSFETDKFSTYAIAYVDEVSSNDSKSDVTLKNPKTYDEGIRSSINLLIISLIGMIGNIIYLKKIS